MYLKIYDEFKRLNDFISKIRLVQNFPDACAKLIY
ncbi:hypothetical protein CLV51_11333 [Chitinophaga niastensis]|uniref:Uncharacterized protein n=1 Tax=Chitinophaga niastensis TaxID=536980 RepID=A0A2P8H836_CHINA|nr:hypothetical protein CLV51_11333 [Chitinophaga niastensis]